MARWFVLFVRTGMELLVSEQLRAQLDANQYFPFVITKETLFWCKGASTIIRKPLFPSYVIIKTSCEPTIVLADMKHIINKNKDMIFNILTNDRNRSEDTNIMIHESEQAMWESLVDSDFCIRASEGKLNGGKIEITSGPLFGNEGNIKSVNKYKRKAILDVEFAGEFIEIGVALKLSG